MDTNTMMGLLGKIFADAHLDGTKAVWQFVFTGSDPIWVETEATAKIATGTRADAGVTIEISPEAFTAVAEGRANVEQLFAKNKIKVAGNFGLAMGLPRLIAMALTGAPAKSITTAASAPRHKPRVRRSEAISARQPPLRAIERRPRESLTVEEFRAKYVATGTPLIITNDLADSELVKVGIENGATYFQGAQGFTRNGDYVNAAFSDSRDFRPTQIAEFIKTLGDPPPSSEPLPAYMGNNAFPKELMSLIGFPSWFPREQYALPRMWLGPAGTLTPLHRDNYDNLFAQIWGRKAFVLAAPHEREHVYAWSSSEEKGIEGCDFDPEKPDYERFPLARDASTISFTVEAGELLFIPEGWFHRVHSLTPSLSINFWTTTSRDPASE